MYSTFSTIKGALAACALIALGSTVQAQVVLTTSPTGSDTVDWSVLGPAYTTVSSPFTISSSMTAAAGANIQVGRVYAMNIGLSTVDGRQIVYSAAIVAN